MGDTVFYDYYTVEDSGQQIIEPVTEDMVKNDLMIEESSNANDTVIGTYITTARNMIEDHINNMVAPRNFTTVCTGYIQSVQLRTPVIDILTVTVTDLDDNEIILTSTDYVLIRSSGVCQLDIDYDIKKIEVSYRAGMDDVPSALQQACLRVIRSLYSNLQTDLSSMHELDVYRRYNI